MQTVSTADKSLLEGFHKISLHMTADGSSVPVDIINCVYHAAVGGGDGFSVGNSCASYAELTLAGTGHALSGLAAALDWSVNTAHYPLIRGIFGPPEEADGQTRITIYDALYTTGSDAYQAEAGITTALAMLSDVAAKLGTTLDAGRFADALAAITVGSGGLNWRSLSAVAGELALIVGASAIISRSGALTLVGKPGMTAPETACYAGEGRTGDAYTVTGVTLMHEEQSYAAGDGALALESSLASQAAADRILSEWSGVSWHKAAGRIPGGLLLEPGDRLPMTTEAGTADCIVHVLTLTLDGGCAASVESLGAAPSETGGAPGKINQQLQTIKADVADVRRLNADEAWVNRLFSNDINAEQLSISAGESVERGIKVTLKSKQGVGGGFLIEAESAASGLSASVSVQPEQIYVGGNLSTTGDIRSNGNIYVGIRPLKPVLTGRLGPVEIPAGTDKEVGIVSIISSGGTATTQTNAPTVLVSLSRMSATSANFGYLTCYTYQPSVNGVSIHVANRHTAAFTVYVDYIIIDND